LGGLLLHDSSGRSDFVAAGITSRLLPPEILARIHYYPPALRAVHFLNSRLSENIRLEDVARAAGMERCAFSRFFSERIGITYSDLTRILRVERALAAFESQDVSIGEVAAMVGIANGATFIRTFRRIIGCTPSEYKRRRDNTGKALHR
jgi:transcriptional regulator GlxA family with amidase domain